MLSGSVGVIFTDKIKNAESRYLGKWCWEIASKELQEMHSKQGKTGHKSTSYEGNNDEKRTREVVNQHHRFIFYVVLNSNL